VFSITSSPASLIFPYKVLSANGVHSDFGLSQGDLSPFIRLRFVAISTDGKAKMLLLLRIESPSDRAMVVEASLDRDFLERALKLVLICAKIRRTMNGAAKVTIERGRGPYVLLESQPVIQWVITKAGVKDWQAVRYLVVPDDLLLGRIGRCLVLTGMRSSTTVVDEEGLWFQGRDDTRRYSSIKVDRQGLNRLLQLK
jgi:hypothetical protein